MNLLCLVSLLLSAPTVWCAEATLLRIPVGIKDDRVSGSISSALQVLFSMLSVRGGVLEESALEGAKPSEETFFELARTFADLQRHSGGRYRHFDYPKHNSQAISIQSSFYEKYTKSIKESQKGRWIPQDKLYSPYTFLNWLRGTVPCIEKLVYVNIEKAEADGQPRITESFAALEIPIYPMDGQMQDLQHLLEIWPEVETEIDYEGASNSSNSADFLDSDEAQDSDGAQDSDEAQDNYEEHDGNQRYVEAEHKGQNSDVEFEDEDLNGDATFEDESYNNDSGSEAEAREDDVGLGAETWNIIEEHNIPKIKKERTIGSAGPILAIHFRRIMDGFNSNAANVQYPPILKVSDKDYLLNGLIFTDSQGSFKTIARTNVRCDHWFVFDNAFAARIDSGEVLKQHRNVAMLFYVEASELKRWGQTAEEYTAAVPDLLQKAIKAAEDKDKAAENKDKATEKEDEVAAMTAALNGLKISYWG